MEKTRETFIKIMLRHGLNLKLNFNAPGSLQMSRIASLENEKNIKFKKR